MKRPSRFAPTGSGFTARDTRRIKGLAIVLMLYHHLFPFADRLQSGVDFTPLLQLTPNLSSAVLLGLTGKLCVALFFFLGGFGTYLSTHREGCSPDRVLGKKLFRLYSGYWKVFFIAIPLSLLLGVARVTPGIDSFLWNLSGIDLSYNGEWWFFTAFVILTLLYPLMERFLDRKHSSLPFELFVCMLLSALIRFSIPALVSQPWFGSFVHSLFWNKLYTALEWLPCFFMGCIFAKYGLLSQAKELCRQRPILAALAAILTGALIVIFRYKTGSHYYYDFIYAPVLVIAVTAVLNTKAGTILGGVLECVGNESTSIWLLHSFFCYHWCQRLVFAPRYSPLIALWLLVLSFVAAKLIRLFYRLLARAFRLHHSEV